MPTIYELFSSNFSWDRHDGLFGVELETETLNPYDYPKMKYWNTVQDGSLRNFGVEYVLKSPMDLDQIGLAFNEFDSLKFNFLPDSPSTSSHVHINVLNETPLTVANFLVVYTLVENILIHLSGEDRRSNLFCMPIKDAQRSFDNMKRFLKGLSTKNGQGLVFNSRDVKYAALNLASFTRLGSLEVRSFRGVTKSSDIIEFLSTLQTILDFCREEKDPQKIFNSFKEDQKGLVRSLFPKNTLDKVDNWEKMLDLNLWYFASLATLQDWNKLSKQKPSPSFSTQDLDKLSRVLFDIPWTELTEAQQRTVITNYQQRSPLGSTLIPNPTNVFGELLPDTQNEIEEDF